MKAPTRTVLFEDVGRGHRSWTSDIPWLGDCPDGECMERAVHKAKALASRDVDFTVNDDGISGNVLAGMRPVGTWRVVEKASAP